MLELFCELDRSSVSSDAAAIFVAEFLVWWEQAGRVYYGRNGRDGCDEGLRTLASDAVDALGGWRAARRTLRSSRTAVGA